MASLPDRARGPTRRTVLKRGLLGAAVLAFEFDFVEAPHAADEDKDDDDQGGGKDKGDETLAQKAAKRYPQPVAVGAVLNRKVLQPLESQPVLGVVRAIVRTRDETIEAVVEYGGFLGFGRRPIAVPITAMALLSPELEIVDFEPAELAAFPTFDAAGTTPLRPDEIIHIGLAKPSH